MRLILSRKGFDSSAGGIPSPIFPDGSLYALPIPDNRSIIPYDELHHANINVAQIISDLGGKGSWNKQFAHLDPDICEQAYPRKAGWKPIFGQMGTAQGHLRNQGVQTGDLFLFFGLFQPVEKKNGHWCFIRNQPPRHVLWGWLQIGEIIKVDKLSAHELDWARYHPHFHYPHDASNTLYVGAHKLVLPHKGEVNKGAGVFPALRNELQLTHEPSVSLTEWRLPKAFYPEKGKSTLSYHFNRKRWKCDDQYCYLSSVSRGQEFVLELDFYPALSEWIFQLLRQ